MQFNILRGESDSVRFRSGKQPLESRNGFKGHEERYEQFPRWSWLTQGRLHKANKEPY